ncbi:hypothetical protein [Streptomyces sp. SID14515]|uniref:hypothetical protein n=1 Tax=Streptomyces sp. SID14515 TaxID=2706074 RepID=UPI0013C9E3A8|nr:hypothetical protein [Streptomyces sp. SID14515]NEB42408.1 hypothetical protein [Streptomyces sp. SID14515]
MQRRRLIAVAAALVVASGCAPQNDDGPSGGSVTSPSASGSASGVRQAVEAYVQALNSRSVSGLISVGGVKDEEWSRQEANQILSDRGGRGFTVKDVQTQQDMGPDVASVRISAEGKSGKPLRETFTAVREKKAWHLVVFTNQPADQSKESASTDKSAS